MNHHTKRRDGKEYGDTEKKKVKKGEFAENSGEAARYLYLSNGGEAGNKPRTTARPHYM